MARSDIEEPGLEPVGAAHGLGAGGGTRCDGEEGDRALTAVRIRDPVAARPAATGGVLGSFDEAAPARGAADDRGSELGLTGTELHTLGFDLARSALERFAGGGARPAFRDDGG